MKQLSVIVLTLLTFPLYAQVSSDHPINGVMDKYDIKATTISFHPNGACLISTSLNREENTQYLLLIDHYQDMDAVKIDTLETRRPNRSAFSEDGSYIVYNVLDGISDGYTVRRTYEDGQFGPPECISLSLDAGSMYYYSIDADQTLYYYIWFGRDSEFPNGLYVSETNEDGRYVDRELILGDRPNAVAFSPLLLSPGLMVLFQHGKIDKSTNGAYYLRKEDDTWGTDPVRIEELPYAACFTYVDEETIGFLKGGRLQTVDKKQLMAWID